MKHVLFVALISVLALMIYDNVIVAQFTSLPKASGN
jgi:hypothetical protein